MGEDQAQAHFGRGGGMPFQTHYSGGGPGGRHNMSPEDAERFFSQFFGGSDPFGDFNSRSRRGGRGGNIGGSPFDMMFGPGMSGMQGMGGMPSMSGMGGMPRQGRPAMKRYDAIPNGTVVSFKNLVNKADRNGDRGEIVDYDPASGRYTVELEDSDEVLRVRPNNLLQHIHVHVQNLTSSPEMNGLRGTILAWNDHKERYGIYVMDRSRVFSLKPSNVIFETGTVARITGLQAKPELNGKFGTIKGWIRETNRYDVQISEQQVLRLKVENLRV
jgi:hypothetical protein